MVWNFEEDEELKLKEIEYDETKRNMIRKRRKMENGKETRNGKEIRNGTKTM